MTIDFGLGMGERSARAGRVRLAQRVASIALRPMGVLAYGPPIPPEERLLVPDISAWNGQANFETMRNAGASGVMIRATGAWLGVPACFTDLKFYINRAAADDAEFPFGTYHFLSDTLSGQAQADYFLEKTQVIRGQLPCVVDVELNSVAASKVRAYVETIYAETLQYPLIYTSSYYWGKVWGATDKTWLSNTCKLWVAHWGTLTPLLPTGWINYAMHQFSADGNGRAAEFGCTGGDPDIDLSYCWRSWFSQYALVEPPIAEKVAILWREAALRGWNLQPY